MSDTIRIILINTFHPGNIGAAARAMKTMGLESLWLVNPQHFPAPEAESMAAGARDLLAQARVVDSLDTAIADCSLVIGTSARKRNMAIPMLAPTTCADKLVQESKQGPVALVFGQETMGMTNNELLKCHYHVAIPANPQYPVLNVSAAAQIMCYEICQAAQRRHACPAEQQAAAPAYPQIQQLELFYQHLETTLDDIDFIVRQHPGLVMTRLRRLFNRARPEVKELQMLRGILSAIQKKSRNH